jgi:lysophospholipase L1-like esterase
VCLVVWNNDLGHDSAIDDIVKYLKDLHALCHERRVPTMAIAIPSSGFQSRFEAACLKRDQVNQQLQEYAASNDMTTFVPFPFNLDGGETWCKNTLHFSPKGYQVLGEYLAPYVEQALHE